MASKGQLTGMRGVYLVASMLAKHGLIASPTSRSAAGADILVTDGTFSSAWSIEVKTNNSSANFWLLGKNPTVPVSNSHVYVFVSIKSSKKTGETVEYYVVPSRIVAKRMRPPDPSWTTASIYRDKMLEYLDNWSVFDSRVRV
jgi:hypothetical protein